LRETRGVRRRRSIEEWRSTEGAHRRGADDSDARMESGAEEGLRWRKTGEEDAWVRKFFWPAGGGSVLTGIGGKGGPEGWTPCGGGVGERGGAWHGVELCGGVASAWQQPGRDTRGRRVAVRQWRMAGSARRGATWLIGGPGHYGGPVVSSWVQHGAAQ
jgi:hypothetical protein